MKRPYPPRVDATAEEMAQAMFSLPAGRTWEYMEAGPEGTVYRCTDCEREVHYPDTLYQDGAASPVMPSSSGARQIGGGQA